MNWRSATSVKELKALGPFRSVKSAIKQEIESCDIAPGLKLQCTSSGWTKLWDAVVAYKKLESNFPSQSSKTKHTETGDIYFRSRKERYLFSLLELDGEDRNRHLGLQEKHVRSQTEAKKWMREIASVIHPDKNGGNPQAERATQKLNELYNLLTS